KGIKDECSRLLEASTMKSRRGFAIQRLMNAMRQAHADGWFIVFDTLTLADDRLEAFYDNPNALRDYFRDIGRMVLAAEGRKANDSHADCYQYFVCLSMVQLMAVFISMRCTLCGHFLQVALTLILVVEIGRASCRERVGKECRCGLWVYHNRKIHDSVVDIKGMMTKDMRLLGDRHLIRS